MKKQQIHTTNRIRFRRWSRKSYAVFSGLHKAITIGHVSAGISNKAILKSNTLSAVSPVFVNNGCLIDQKEKPDTETTIAELLLTTDATPVATDYPAGYLPKYLFNPKLKWSKCLCFDFFILKKYHTPLI